MRNRSASVSLAPIFDETNMAQSLARALEMLDIARELHILYSGSTEEKLEFLFGSSNEPGDVEFANALQHIHVELNRAGFDHVLICNRETPRMSFFQMHLADKDDTFKIWGPVSFVNDISDMIPERAKLLLLTSDERLEIESMKNRPAPQCSWGGFRRMTARLYWNRTFPPAAQGTGRLWKMTKDDPVESSVVDMIAALTRVKTGIGS